MTGLWLGRDYSKMLFTTMSSIEKTEKHGTEVNPFFSHRTQGQLQLVLSKVGSKRQQHEDLNNFHHVGYDSCHAIDCGPMDFRSSEMCQCLRRT